MGRRIRDNLLYALLRVILAIGSRLSLALGRALGMELSRFALRFLKRDRRRMREHVEIAFSELDQKQRDDIIKGCANHLGRVIAEIAWLWRAKPDALVPGTELRSCDT